MAQVRTLTNCFDRADDFCGCRVLMMSDDFNCVTCQNVPRSTKRQLNFHFLWTRNAQQTYGRCIVSVSNSGFKIKIQKAALFCTQGPLKHKYGFVDGPYRSLLLKKVDAAVFKESALFVGSQSRAIESVQDDETASVSTELTLLVPF